MTMRNLSSPAGILTILLFFYSMPILGQSSGAESNTTVQPRPNKNAKPMEIKETAKEPDPKAMTPYEYEITTGIIYDTTKGTVKPADNTEDTKIDETKAGISLKCGWIVSDHLEPFMELSYSSIKRSVAEFKSTETNLDAGVGILVNLPQISSAGAKLKEDQSLNVPDFMLSDWIPYVGILMGSSRVSEKRGQDGSNDSTVTDSNTFTKFLVGTRLMLYHHVSMNFGVRILYENSSTKAETDSKRGADRSKMEFEFDLMSLSLFI